MVLGKKNGAQAEQMADIDVIVGEIMRFLSNAFHA